MKRISEERTTRYSLILPALTIICSLVMFALMKYIEHATSGYFASEESSYFHLGGQIGSLGGTLGMLFVPVIALYGILWIFFRNWKAVFLSAVACASLYCSSYYSYDSYMKLRQNPCRADLISEHGTCSG